MTTHQPAPMSPRRQADRRSETRELLLQAAATAFAEHGFVGASTDAIAAAAGRTSGALYAHFGSKQGLLAALLDRWEQDTTAAMGAALVDETDMAGRMEALWHTLAHVDEGDTGLLLEHELWLYAVRHPEARETLARRYRIARNATAHHISSWSRTDGEPSNGSSRADEVSLDTAALVMALLLGLEMLRRLDPASVSDDLAVEGLMRLFDDGVTSSPDSQPIPEQERSSAHRAM